MTLELRAADVLMPRKQIAASFVSVCKGPYTVEAMQKSAAEEIPTKMDFFLHISDCPTYYPE